ncbi:Uncharacterised protein [Yersinia enterocolitica]|nr:Uncharacterised protein [Yersinia enterocolitica]
MQGNSLFGWLTFTLSGSHNNQQALLRDLLKLIITGVNQIGVKFGSHKVIA